MRVQCPGCRLALKIPDNAAGKQARCPSCRTKFVVPKRMDAVEETISSWIEEDVEQMQAETREVLDRKARAARAAEEAALAHSNPAAPAAPVAKPPPQPQPQPAQTTAETSGGDEGSDTIDINAPAGAESTGLVAQVSASHSEKTVPTAPEPAAEPDTPDEALSSAAPEPRAETPVQPHHEEPVPPPPRPAVPALPTHHPAPAATHDSPAAAAAAAAAAVDDAQFPTELVPVGPRPYLMIQSCSAEGVRIAFDAAWLEHPGFQTSLPQRCVFGGVAERTELLARPMAFVDRSRGAVRAPRDLEVRYEHRLSANQTVEQMIGLIGRLDWLPSPFNSPVPYYVSPAHSRNSLACSTVTRPTGEYTCIVLVPDGQYALDWVERVNGTTGREYQLLKRVVGLMWNEAWSKIPEEARRRIAAWCTFEPMESFKIFLSDADFGRNDFGLGGIVLTDRRLIFSKFHRRGQCNLKDPAILQVQTEDDFALLSLNTDEGKTKVAKLHLSDISALIKGLSGSTGLKLQVG